MIEWKLVPRGTSADNVAWTMGATQNGVTSFPEGKSGNKKNKDVFQSSSVFCTTDELEGWRLS